MAIRPQDPCSVPLRFYTKDDCPLCDRLERMVTPLLAAHGMTFEKESIKNSPDLQRRYGLRIPVLTLGDQVVLEGRPSEGQVRRAIDGLPLRGNNA